MTQQRQLPAKRPVPTTRLLIATIVVAAAIFMSLLGVAFAIRAGTPEAQSLIALGVVSGPPFGALLAKALLWFARDAVRIVRITVYMWLSEAAVAVLSLLVSRVFGVAFGTNQFNAIPDSLVLLSGILWWLAPPFLAAYLATGHSGHDSN